LGAPKNSEAKYRKRGLGLESELVQKLDTYAEKRFKGNRSAAANFLLSAL
jgi:hypothetical protein